MKFEGVLVFFCCCCCCFVFCFLFSTGNARQLHISALGLWKGFGPSQTWCACSCVSTETGFLLSL